MGCFCLLLSKRGRIEASSLTSWSPCFLFCKEVMCDSKALSLLPLPAGSPLCPLPAGLAPGFKNLMAGYAPAHFVAITLLTGLRDSYTPQYEVRSTLSLPSSFFERSQPWALQRVKLERSFSHHLSMGHHSHRHCEDEKNGVGVFLCREGWGTGW